MHELPSYATSGHDIHQIFDDTFHISKLFVYSVDVPASSAALASQAALESFHIRFVDPDSMELND
jgi:hypothetical protein